MIPIPVKTTLKSLLKFKNDNIQTLMIVVGDQTPPKHEIQYWTNFLNQDTPLYLGVEKIAKKMDQVVVFMRIDKIKSGYYEVSFIKLFDDPVNTKEYEISEKHLRTLENIIKEKPQYWLWSHRRWKHKKQS
jgi:KDO2-lipid IV(A) lauroyltransferase